jgi:hypothetical protein
MEETEWMKGILTSLQDWEPCKNPRDVREVSRLIRDTAKTTDLNKNIIETVYTALLDCLGATQKSEDTPDQSGKLNEPTVESGALNVIIMRGRRTLTKRIPASWLSTYGWVLILKHLIHRC